MTEHRDDTEEMSFEEDVSGTTVDAAASDESAGVWGDEDAPASDDGAVVWSDGGVVTAAPIAHSGPSGADPVVRGLLVLALSLVVALLATTGVLYFYMSTLNHAPRTVIEQSISTGEAKAKEAPQSVEAWQSLALAYAAADRWDDALDAAAKGEKLPDGEILAVVHADILRMAERNDEAVEAYDQAEKKVTKYLARIKNERAKVGVTAPIDDDTMFRVYWGRGLAYKSLGDSAAAIKDLERAVKENGQQTEIWVALGDLYAEQGREDDAKEAYQKALVFVADLKSAKDGLARLEKGK